MEDLTGQVNGTDSILDTEWNDFYQEFKNFIEAFVTMSQGDLSQLRKVGTALSVQGQWTNCSGGTLAYVLGMNTGVAAPPAYALGQVFQFRPNANNTVGAVTVNVGSLGAISLVREDGSALQANDLSTSRDAVIRKTGTSFRLLNFTLAAGSADLPDGFISGLTMGRNSAEPATEFRDIDTQPGSCRNSANTGNLVNGTAMVKRWDASWALGTALGGYPGTLGARATGTWYRYFAVGRSDTGATDFGFDSVANDDAATLLADVVTATGSALWTWYRQIGWVRTTAGDANELEPFSNDPSDPDGFYWTNGSGSIDYESATFGTSGIAQAATTIDFAAPGSTAINDWFGWNVAASGAADIYGVIAPIGHPDVAPSRTVATVWAARPGSSGNTASAASQIAADMLGTTRVALDSSGQLNTRWDASASNARVYTNTLGFIFKR